MRAIISTADGPVVQDVPRPSPGPEEVLVRVRANSLNRADLMMLKGSYLGGLEGSGFPLGLEWAGEARAAAHRQGLSVRGGFRGL